MWQTDWARLWVLKKVPRIESHIWKNSLKYNNKQNTVLHGENGMLVKSRCVFYEYVWQEE